MFLWSGLIVLIVLIVVVGWAVRGRRKSSPESHPGLGDLGTAEDIVALDEAHDKGEISDEDYHARRSQLLS